MWTCPGCGRQFRNTNQGHFCANKPKTIDEYISCQDAEKQPALAAVRRAIAQALPNAEERFSWDMPTFWQGRNIAHFAAFKNHIGFYPGAEAVAHFAAELAPYRTDKGTVRLPYGEIDERLIEEIAAWCLDGDARA